jgi:hypothetical protein
MSYLSDNVPMTIEPIGSGLQKREPRIPYATLARTPERQPKPGRIIPMTAKVLFDGKTHNTNGLHGAARSSDGFLDIKIPQPHPAAEDMFGAAWSACYMGAIELAATQKKIKLPPEISVDADIKLKAAASS